MGATRAAATGLAFVGLLGAGAATADVLGVHNVPVHIPAAEAWDIPAQVDTLAPAPVAPTPPVKVPADGPTKLRIPSIAVNTTLEALGLDADGHLNAPAYTDAGWYAAGTNPGDVGPAVIAGHYDGATAGTPSVFYRLGDLKDGDTIQVQRSGKWISFTVTAVASYAQDSFPTGIVYGPTPTPELRLITCAGSYSAATASYTENLVVFATEAP